MRNENILVLYKIKNALIQAYLAVLQIFIFLNIWEPNLHGYVIFSFHFIKKVRFDNFVANFRILFQNTKLAVCKCEIAHNNAPLIVSKSIENKVIQLFNKLINFN